MVPSRFAAPLVLAGAAGLVASLFLPWYGISVSTPIGSFSGTSDAWHSTGKIAAALLAVGAISLVLGVMHMRSPSVHAGLIRRLTPLAAVAVALVAFRLWSGPFDATTVGGSQGPVRHLGVFAALVSAFGLLMGARAMQQVSTAAER